MTFLRVISACAVERLLSLNDRVVCCGMLALISIDMCAEKEDVHKVVTDYAAMSFHACMSRPRQARLSIRIMICMPHYGHGIRHERSEPAHNPLQMPSKPKKRPKVQKRATFLQESQALQTWTAQTVPFRHVWNNTFYFSLARFHLLPAETAFLLRVTAITPSPLAKAT